MTAGKFGGKRGSGRPRKSMSGGLTVAWRNIVDATDPDH